MKPWALLPFELIKHADEHAKAGSDFDRRMALIGFDNVIEVAIITYLSLNPIQRDNLQFPREQVVQWERNFHSKLNFLEYFVTSVLREPMQYEKDEIVFYHDIRNDIYHRGIGVVPAESHINGVRAVAIWVFKTLFKVDPEPLLEEGETNSTPLVEASNESSDVASNLSDQTKFLELFISIRRDLNMLMRMTGDVDARDSAQIPPLEAWRKVFSTQDNASPEYQEALQDAENIRTAIVEGESSEEIKPDLREVAETLAEVSTLIRTELRAFQVSIVQKSLEATLSAAGPDGNRRAGIVWQTPGSGLTTSMLAYIQGVLSFKEFSETLILVASDRNARMEQTWQRFQQANIHHSAQCVASISELVDVLQSNEPKVVFTTVQKLFALRDRTFKRSNLLFVGNNLQSSTDLIKQTLPNAVFILFTTNFVPEAVAVYGDLIAKYSLQQAIEDRVASPVQYEIRNLGVPQKFEFLENEITGETPLPTMTLERIEAIAQDLLQHVEQRGVEKAIVVTSRLDYADRLLQSILKIKPEWNERRAVFTVSAVLSNSERWDHFIRLTNPHDPFKIAIVSSAFLVGLDAKIKTVYLVNTLPKNAVRQAIGLVSRGSPDEPGLIVDYGHNLKTIRESEYELGH